MADIYYIIGDVGLCPSTKDNYKGNKINGKVNILQGQDKEESGRHIFGPYPWMDKDGFS